MALYVFSSTSRQKIQLFIKEFFYFVIFVVWRKGGTLDISYQQGHVLPCVWFLSTSDPSTFIPSCWSWVLFVVNVKLAMDIVIVVLLSWLKVMNILEELICICGNQFSSRQCKESVTQLLLLEQSLLLRPQTPAFVYGASLFSSGRWVLGMVKGSSSTMSVLNQ